MPKEVAERHPLIDPKHYHATLWDDQDGDHDPSGATYAFADRLRERGKPHKVIIIAVARKLVTIANALCKSRQMWANQIA